MNLKNKKIYLSALCFLILILGVNILEAKETITSPERFINALNNRPKDLNQATIKNFEIYDKEIIFKDQTFSGTEFFNLTLKKAVMNNVTFNNCIFKKTAFYDVTMENVTFNNCRFEVQGNANISDNQAYFHALKMKNVTFNGGNFKYFFGSVHGGGHNVILKNIKVKGNLDDYYHIFFVGNDLSLRIDNCEFENTDLYDGDGKYKATMYVTNSKFKNSTQSGTNFFKTIWYENCHFDNTGSSLGVTTILKDSYLSGSFEIGTGPTKETQKVYVSNCAMPKRWITEDLSGAEYWGGVGFGIDKNNAEVYIYGNPQHKEIALTLDGGKYYIFDVDIAVLDLRTFKDELAAEPDLKIEPLEPIELNLKNVTIKGGPWSSKSERPNVDWAGATITKGMWDNVKIYPIVNMKSARVENLLVHNLQFPEGLPWINANANTFAPYKERKVPLDIPKPPLPTLEEVGIIDPLK